MLNYNFSLVVAYTLKEYNSKCKKKKKERKRKRISYFSFYTGNVK